MKKGSIVGDLINFRGMVYSPLNENGVVFLFGKIVEDLNMYIEEIKPGYPDCIARRFVGNGWEQVAIEFEMYSSNFKTHKHDPKLCDIIICWEHDWQDIPKEYEIEVIELRSLINSLPNREIQRPIKGKLSKTEIELENNFLKRANPEIKVLYEKVKDLLLKLDEAVWQKFGEKYSSFYSPKRVFTYLRMQKTGIRIMLFTGGKTMDGVKSRTDKWGVFRLTNESQLSQAKKKWIKSLESIREAVHNNENTGWYAKIEDDDENEN